MVTLSSIISYGTNIAQIADDRIAASDKISSNNTGITGADRITNVVSLTQEEYDNIIVKDQSTFYIVTN